MSTVKIMVVWEEDKIKGSIAYNNIGNTYNRLTVLKILGLRDKALFVECRCICGTIKAVRFACVSSGNVKSCGCLKIETDRIKGKKPIIHGHSIVNKITSEYETWHGMKQRCYSPKNSSYHNYGAKGIKVCKRWRTSFIFFLKDMGSKPTKNHSIDRFPNKNGNYKPSNCRWATKKEQAENRNNTPFVLYKNKPTTLLELSKKIGIPYQTLFGRYNNGKTGKNIWYKGSFRELNKTQYNERFH